MISSNTFNSTVSGKTTTPITSSIHTRNGKYSVGIVCSEKNGKRITITSALASKLNLAESVYITAFSHDGFIVLGSSSYDENSSEYKLSGGDKKVVYNSELVHYLIETFKLNYIGRVSRSFGDITFNNDQNASMAILRFPHTVEPVQEDAEVNDEANVDDNT